jgi:hypothetical protein
LHFQFQRGSCTRARLPGESELGRRGRFESAGIYEQEFLFNSEQPHLTGLLVFHYTLLA